ncbi:MAG: ribonuclease P protein component [Alkalispirochaeta sp.]
MRRSLTKAEILRRRRDISRVFRSEHVHRVRGLHLRVIPNDVGWSRVLFAATRRFSGAVERNRARRLVREAYRLYKPEIAGNYDVAFVLYPGSFSYSDRCSQVETLLRRAELIS